MFILAISYTLTQHGPCITMDAATPAADVCLQFIKLSPAKRRTRFLWIPTLYRSDRCIPIAELMGADSVDAAASAAIIPSLMANDGRRRVDDIGA